MFRNYRPGKLLILLVMIFAASGAFAAVPTLESAVSTNNVPPDASVLLTLKLFNATATSDPDTSPLDPYFDIEASQKAESVQWSDDAKPVTVTRWQYQLRPKQHGKLTIPTLIVATDRGAVSSRPVFLDVAESKNPGKPFQQPQDEAADVKIEAKIDRDNPYVGEVILCQVLVFRGSNIMNSFLDRPTAGAAKVEPLGDPDNSNVYDGDKRWMRSLFRFAVTPLQVGEMVINPITIKGTSYGHVVKGRMNNPFYDAASDPFATFNSMLSQQSSPLPFTKASESMKVTVRDIPSGWSKPASWWLPAQYVTMSQQFSGNNVKVGEAIKRRIRIDLLGATASALDNMEERLRENTDMSKWKIYLDKPDVQTGYDQQYGMVKTSYVQNISYVPVESGTLEIPPLVLPWWSIKDDKLYASTIEAQKVEVSPNFGLSSGNSDEKAPAVQQSSGSDKSKILLLSFIAIASSAAFFWLWLSHNSKLLHMIQRKPHVKPWVKSAKIPLPAGQLHYAAVMRAGEPAKLISAADAYMHHMFKMPAHMRLPERAEWVGKLLNAGDAATLNRLCLELEASVYGGSDIDVKEWKRQFFSLLGKAEKNYKDSGGDSAASAPPPLNP